MNKEQLLKENSQACIQALEFYLDYLSLLSENYLEEGSNPEDLKLKSDFKENDELVQLLNDLNKNISKYESVRRKLLNNDFKLSTQEIDIVGLSLFFWEKTSENRIKDLRQANYLTKNLRLQLLEGSDFQFPEDTETLEIPEVFNID